MADKPLFPAMVGSIEHLGMIARAAAEVDAIYAKMSRYYSGEAKAFVTANVHKNLRPALDNLADVLQGYRDG